VSSPSSPPNCPVETEATRTPRPSTMSSPQLEVGDAVHVGVRRSAPPIEQEAAGGEHEAVGARAPCEQVVARAARQLVRSRPAPQPVGARPRPDPVVGEVRAGDPVGPPGLPERGDGQPCHGHVTVAVLVAPSASLTSAATGGQSNLGMRLP
jgi:hypothetical protein